MHGSGLGIWHPIPSLKHQKAPEVLDALRIMGSQVPGGLEIHPRTLRNTGSNPSIGGSHDLLGWLECYTFFLFFFVGLLFSGAFSCFVSGEVYLIKQDAGSIEYLGRSCSSASLTLKREPDSTGFLFLSYPLHPKKPWKK